MKKTQNQFSIQGMQCVDCENNIEETVQSLPGIFNAKANFTSETLIIEFDADKISVNTICAAINKTGYSCQEFRKKKTGGIFKRFALIILAASGIALILQLENYVDIGYLPDGLEQGLSFGLIFLVGVFTSFHCIGMCGGFVISYTAAGSMAGRPTPLSHLAYGLGKTLSYTLFGAIFGLLGGAMTFTPELRALIAGLAGGFLILYGLSMLDTFSGLRRFHIRLPKYVVRTISEKRKHLSNPLVIGLLNGLMIACGPLQAMYILAAGTGDPLQGAKLLFFFALGTLPVMYLFGYLTGLITANTTRNLLKISGFIIITLGTVMLNRSLVLNASGYDFNSVTAAVKREFTARFMAAPSRNDTATHYQNGYQVIYMEVESSLYRPNSFSLQKGIPVKWIINVQQLSNCNARILIPSLDISIALREGLQLIEFTPRESGSMNWSCSMGMMTGTFFIEEANSNKPH